MYNHRIFLLIFLACLSSLKAAAQDTDFWFAAPDPSESWYIPTFFMITNVSNLPATVTMTFNNGGSPVVNMQTIAAGGYWKYDITTAAGAAQVENPRAQAGNAAKYGIHITSTRKITAYYMIASTDSRDIFTLKGKSGLGKEFYVPMQSDNYLTTGSYPGACDQIDIVATVDGTTVTVTPKTAIRIGTSGSSPANTTITRTLQKGETLKIMEHTVNSNPSLAGTRITSNNDIAVTVIEDLVGGDTSGDQIVPVASLGTTYVVAKGYMTTAAAERLYIVSTRAGTNISVNGTSVASGLAAGSTHLYIIPPASNAVTIHANYPIYVYQRTGYNEQGAALLPSIFAFHQNSISFFVTPATQEKIFLIYRTGQESGFTYTRAGATSALNVGTPTAVPNITGWSVARLDLPAGSANNVVTIANPKSIFSLGYIAANPTGNIMTCYGNFTTFGNEMQFSSDTVWQCNGAPVTLDGGYALTYDWTLPNGSHAYTATVVAADTGLYKLTVDYDPNTSTDVIRVLNRFEGSGITSSGAGEIGAGAYTYTANAGIYTDKYVDYIWKVDGVQVSTDKTIDRTWNNDDEHVITLSMRDTEINCTTTHTIIHHKMLDNIIDAHCYSEPPPTVWDIKKKATSSTIVQYLATPFAGDIDKDGRVEVVVPDAGNGQTSDNILIFDDQLNLKRTISTPGTPQHFTTSLMIADVDGDGYGEIIVGGIDKQLRCYSHTGALKWTTTAVYNTSSIGDHAHYGVSLVAADATGTGRPLILACERIYLGTNGTHLFTLPAGGRGFAAAGPESFMPVFADIDNDGIQEVVAGNTVYKLNITNFNGTAYNSATLIQAPSGLPDGFTSVADIDMDGDLDVIVTGTQDLASPGTTACMYVWDGATSTQIGTTVTVNSAGRRISRAFAGDILGDGRPEIAFTWTNRINAYRYDPVGNQFISLWGTGNPTTDNSGATTLSMFDFNQDGEVEIVYRDAQNLRIIDKDGNDRQAIKCLSSTHTEYPIIVDLDRDGHADIVVTGGETSNEPQYVRLVCFSSLTPGAWAPARSVWNQHAYNAGNINEDLSIPRHPLSPTTRFPGQNGILGDGDDLFPYNNFLQQQTVLSVKGKPLWLLPDFSIETDLAVNYYSVGDSLVVSNICVQNKGDARGADSLKIALYKDSRLPANLLQVYTVPAPASLGAGGQRCYKIKYLGASAIATSALHIEVNDNGTAYVQTECDDHSNNGRAVFLSSMFEARNDSMTVFACGSNSINVLANDLNTAGTTASIVTPGSYGAIVQIAGNMFTYNCAISNCATLGGKRDVVSYQLTKGVNTSTANIFIDILPAPDIVLRDSCSRHPYLHVVNEYPGATYQWSRSATGAVGTWAAIGGATDSRLYVTDDAWYKAEITYKSATGESTKLHFIIINKRKLPGGAVWYESRSEK